MYDDWALSWGNLHDTIVLMDGTDLPVNTLFTATIAKRGDRWLVIGFHASVNAFHNPALSLAVHKTVYWAAGVGAGLGLVAGIILGILLRRRKSAAHTVTPLGAQHRVLDPEDIELLDRAEKWCPEATLAALSVAKPGELSKTEGLDFATAVLHDRILRAPANAEFTYGL